MAESIQSPTTIDETTPVLSTPGSVEVQGGENIKPAMICPENLIYTLKPMNTIVTLAVPQVGTESPIFALRVTPKLPSSELTPRATNFTLDPSKGVDEEGNPPGPYQLNENNAWEHPGTFIQTGRPSTLDGVLYSNTVQPIRGISLVQGAEPLFSRWCKQFRYWNGPIIYKLQIVSNFTVQGYLRLGICCGTYFKKMFAMGFTSSVFPSGNVILETDSTETANNGWLRIDLSDKKHAIIMVPFQHNLPFIDDMWRGPFRSAIYNVPETDQYLCLQLEGTTTAGNNNTIQIIFEYAAGPNFELACPLGPFVNEFRSSTAYNLGTAHTGAFIYRPIWYYHFTTYFCGDPNMNPTTWPMRRADYSGTEAYVERFESSSDFIDRYKTLEEEEDDPATRSLRRNLHSIRIDEENL